MIALRMPAPLLRMTWLRSNLSVFGNQALASAVNLLITLLLVRVVGLAEFGRFAVYYVIAFSVGAVANALITQPMASLVSSAGPEAKMRIIATAGRMTLLVIGGLAVTAAIAAVPAMQGNGSALGVVVVAVMSAASLAVEFARRALFLLGARGAVWASDLVRYAVLWGGFLSNAQWGGQSAEVYGAILAVSGLVSLAIPAFAARRLAAGQDTSWSRADAGALLGQGRWLSVSALLQLANDQLFFLAGSSMVGAAAIGAVRTGQSIVSVVNPLLIALEYVVPKWLGGALAEQGRATALRRYLVVSAGIAAICGLCLLVVALFAPPILQAVTGADSPDQEAILRLLCVLWELNCLSLLLSFLLRAFGQARPVFMSLAISATISLAICVPIISGLGVLGIVLGMILAQSISVTAMGAFAWRYLARQTQ